MHECKNIIFDEGTGDRVCTKCGLVAEERCVSNDFLDNTNRGKDTPFANEISYINGREVVDPYLKLSNVRTTFNTKDIRETNKYHKFNRMKILQHRSAEKIYFQMNNELLLARGLLELPIHIVNIIAFEMGKIQRELGFLRGTSKCFLGAVIYRLKHTHGFYRSMKSISEMLNIKKSDIWRCYNILEGIK